MKQKILAGIAILAACLLCIVAGMRDDREVTAVATGNTASLTLPANSAATIYICQPETLAVELPETLTLAGQTADIDPPRPLKLHRKLAESFDVATDLSCGSLRIALPDAAQHAAELTIHIPNLPDGTLVIAASSKNAGWLPLLLLFAVFIGSLFTATSIASRQAKPFRPGFFKPYDALTAFFASLGLALLLSMPFADALIDSRSAHILPSFLTFLPVISVNFVAMLATFGCFVWFRSTKSHTTLTIHNTPSDDARQNARNGENTLENTAPPSDDAPQFHPVRSFTLGLFLAIVAAITLGIISPTVELTTLDMATQLTATSYLTFIFAILAGVSEECIFRGIIQSSLEARPGAKHPLATNIAAIAIATALFVGVHVPQSLEHLWALIPIGCVSITSGILKIKYRTLYPSILLHMTYNTTLLLPSMLQLFLFLR